MKDEQLIQKVLGSLEANRFYAVFAKDRDDAREKIRDMVPRDATVGIADSATLRQIGIIDDLEKRVERIVNPFVKEFTADLNTFDTRQRLKLESLRCDIFLTGTNALTTDGKLVNIDGDGNRVAGMIFGPQKAIVVVGRNKIVSNVDEALKRIKNVIAPAHAKRKKMRVPCAAKGRCVDCNSKERICNVTTIMEKKPFSINITVVLVNEDLGLGWDATWPEERRRRIESEYGEVTWEMISPWHTETKSKG